MNKLVTMNKKSLKAVVVPEEEAQYLTFLLGRELFAISITSIKEIIEYGQITPVPLVPGFVRGIINLRGQVVPVIDMQVRLGRESSPVSKRTCIVIFEVAMPDESQEVVGIVVDSVSEVLGMAASQIERAPHFGSNVRHDFIAGLGKIDNKFVILLNVEKVLSMEELSSMVETIEAETEAEDTVS
jgi:purine-binding chemotaxis protein CheW